MDLFASASSAFANADQPAAAARDVPARKPRRSSPAMRRSGVPVRTVKGEGESDGTTPHWYSNSGLPEAGFTREQCIENIECIGFQGFGPKPALSFGVNDRAVVVELLRSFFGSEE